MLNQPQIEHRPSRPYLGVATTTSLDREAEVIPARLRQLEAWMASRGLRANGSPFVRYHRIEMPHRLDIEVGVPLADAADGEGEVIAGELPAGRYAVLLHTGPLDELVEANAALQRWAELHQVRFDVEEQGPASVWAARIEASLTDPEAEPDPRGRQTEIAYLLA
jgi:effector-binding domain-containing protein